MGPIFTAAGNQGTMAQIHSPFDTCGGGTLAPLAHLSNFNVVVSGANVFNNSIKYNYEMFQNHVLGTNSVNGGLTDGVGSSLINSLDWETAYPYYVADVGRMLDVEKNVPKSLSIVGQNVSAREIDLYVFGGGMTEFESELEIIMTHVKIHPVGISIHVENAWVFHCVKLKLPKNGMRISPNSTNQLKNQTNEISPGETPKAQIHVQITWT